MTCGAIRTGTKLLAVSAALLIAGAVSPATAVEVRSAVTAAQADLASGSLGAAVRATAGLGQVQLLEVAPLGSTAGRAGVPAGLASPVTRLLDAVDAAEGLVARAIPAGAGLQRSLGDQMRIGRLLVAATAAVSDVNALRDLQEIGRQAGQQVDEPALYSAAFALAQAIDASLPGLRAAAGAPGSGEAIVGCDVVDLPQLCIGNTGSNTYVSDRALVIDLGGDDVHTHSAGGASPLSNGLPVAVTIDVSGNDRYERSDGIAQGAGNLGVGILVDAAGDDRYSIAATKGAESAAGQGTNFSAGVGVLADLGGNDGYSLTSTRADSAFAAGQGRGAQPGFGLLLDHGAGNEQYVISARPSTFIGAADSVSFGGLNANGMGLGGVGGVGVAYDGGGNDTMTLEAVTPTIPAEEARPVASVPLFGTAGFGLGLTGGVGLMLSGPGDTTRVSTASTSGPWSGIVGSNVFGAGVAGDGTLIDQGGNDVYSASVRSHAARRVLVGDACGCDGGYTEPRMALPNFAAASLRTMGSGLGQGVGVLRDVSGDDQYRATAESIADAEVRDDRTGVGPDGTPGASSAVASANPASLNVQGVGSGGTGLLEDGAGNDVYQATTVVRATASAEASWQEVPVQARAASDRVFTEAQAAATAGGGVPGSGILRDAAGADRYEVSSIGSATAFPETEVSSAELLSSAQASVAGTSAALLHDSDAGALDVFVLAPADPACEGKRGEGTWRDCGAGAGVGVLDDDG